ncbi:glycosyltransferase [Methylobacterium sp. C25]|uniref:glycosyltransferase family 2 protein n=1 Tax=Methylobacterium sp. C25 TaxID=2721622 RepID=UPI001F48BA70|nr:glycosyltransferase family 2 protein [Methylobacterium sp. C25]MCE4224702.1 glycosyltransferase [Methylobacterium sp. C25]
MAVLDRSIVARGSLDTGARPEEVVLPREIGFLLAHGISYRALANAAEAARLGRADVLTTLLNTGVIDEERYYRALALTLDTTFVEDVRLYDKVRHSEVLDVDATPLAREFWPLVAVAPRGRAVARLIDTWNQRSVQPAITTPTRLRNAVFAQRADEIAAEAADDLRQHHPEWSCRPGLTARDLIVVGAVVGLGLLFTSLPNGFSMGLLALTQLATIALLMVRFCAAGVPSSPEPSPEIRLLNDAALPTYTVLVALYREASVVEQLVGSLKRLDYPAAKLDIKLLLEADDAETAEALRAIALPPWFEIVTAPPGLPRTKPRALNVALPLARGRYLVVYDAEDVIERQQLRLAATLFARAPKTTACLQGRLVVDNYEDGWLTRLFALEYSALFDVLGPALAAWRMPTPLGGTTTHFRTRVLRELRGWDAWNVTEDADLGMRLALAGYHVGDLPSDTKEEGLRLVKPWLRQRTRWMKGFLQTTFTHLRNPAETAGRLGPLGSLFAVTLLPGTVLSALVYPFLSLWTVYRLISGPDAAPDILAEVTSLGTHVVFIGGIVAMLLPALLACMRRRWFGLMPWALLLPLYFGLVSAAAWLAVFELARHPHRWNKTEHGLARTSRSGARLTRKGAGVRSASSVPRPSPAAVAAG